MFTKVGIDQLLWNPIFGMVFFTYLGFADGHSPEQVKDKILADLPTAVSGSWAFWIPAHTINFRFIPPQQRILYINTLQIAYNVFLSFLGNKEVKKTEVKTEVKKE